MKQYKILAYNQEFSIIKKTMQAQGDYELRELLASSKLTPISVRELNTRRRKSNNDIESEYNVQGKLASRKDLYLFTEQIDVLLQSGISLLEAIQLASTTLQKNKFHTKLQSIIHELTKGRQFSSLIRDSNLFPKFYVEIISVGERSNNHKVVFHELAQFLKQETDFQKKILSALIYPFVVIGLLIVGTILFVSLFLPNYLQLIEELIGDNATIIKQRVDVFYILLVSLFSLFFLITAILWLSRHSYWLRSLLHRIALAVPVLGKGIMSYNLMWVCFLIKSLLEGGETLTRAFGFSSQLVKNIPIAKGLSRVGILLQNGHKPVDALHEVSVLPAIMTHWFEVGEMTEHKYVIFDKMHIYFKNRTNQMLNIVTTMLQPIITVLLGLSIILLIQLLIIPLFEVYTYV